MNLVIHDWTFYKNESLDKDLSPWAHINYVGWIPVQLAISGLFFLRESKRKREVTLLLLITILVFAFSSRDLYLLVKNWDFVEQFDSLNVAASLAVQPLLMLAAIAMQEIIDHKWTNVVFTVSTGTRSSTVSIVKWVLLIVVMFVSIRAPLVEGASFRATKSVVLYKQDLALLDITSAQWIRPLNNDWIPFLLSADKKIIIGRSWEWKDRESVVPKLRVVDSKSGADTTGTTKIFGDHNLIDNPGQQYAFINAANVQTPCAADALGGNIRVTCTADQAGELTVREYSLKGWYAWMDGVPVQLDTTKDFLSLPAASGTHIYEFRYRPWDVYFGMGLSLLAIILTSLLIFSRKVRDQNL